MFKMKPGYLLYIALTVYGILNTLIKFVNSIIRRIANPKRSISLKIKVIAFTATERMHWKGHSYTGKKLSEAQKASLQADAVAGWLNMLLFNTIFMAKKANSWKDVKMQRLSPILQRHSIFFFVKTAWNPGWSPWDSWNTCTSFTFL